MEVQANASTDRPTTVRLLPASCPGIYILAPLRPGDAAMARISVGCSPIASTSEPYSQTDSILGPNPAWSVCWVYINHSGRASRADRSIAPSDLFTSGSLIAHCRQPAPIGEPTIIDVVHCLSPRHVSTAHLANCPTQSWAKTISMLVRPNMSSRNPTACPFIRCKWTTRPPTM